MQRGIQTLHARDYREAEARGAHFAVAEDAAKERAVHPRRRLAAAAGGVGKLGRDAASAVRLSPRETRTGFFDDQRRKDKGSAAGQG